MKVDTDNVIEGVTLSKNFGGVHALDHASFSAANGEVHALVGENGAGKSTMIKVLGGRLQPDDGTIRLNGNPIRLSGPEQAHDKGVWTVFQELMLFPGMTVAENLLLGREPRRLGVINHRRMGDEADALMRGMGITHIDPLALIEDTSLAQRQIVEIVRALSHDPDILFLDEPTSSLVEREVNWLFERIRALRDRGACVVFTSHRWNEVRRIADRITVFRNGRDVGTFTELTEDEAVTLMTGQKLEALFPPRPPPPAAEPVLQRGCTLRGPPARHHVQPAPGRNPRRRRPRRPGPPRAVPHAVRRRAPDRRHHPHRRQARPHPQSAPGQKTVRTASPWCPRTARPRACCSA